MIKVVDRGYTTCLFTEAQDGPDYSWVMEWEWPILGVQFADEWYLLKELRYHEPPSWEPQPPSPLSAILWPLPEWQTGEYHVDIYHTLRVNFEPVLVQPIIWVKL